MPQACLGRLTSLGMAPSSQHGPFGEGAWLLGLLKTIEHLYEKGIRNHLLQGPCFTRGKTETK